MTYLSGSTFLQSAVVVQAGESLGGRAESIDVASLARELGVQIEALAQGLAGLAPAAPSEPDARQVLARAAAALSQAQSNPNMSPVDRMQAASDALMAMQAAALQLVMAGKLNVDTALSDLQVAQTQVSLMGQLLQQQAIDGGRIPDAADIGAKTQLAQVSGNTTVTTLKAYRDAIQNLMRKQ